MTAQAVLGGILFGSGPALFAGYTEPPKSEVEAGAENGKEPVNLVRAHDTNSSMMGHLWGVQDPLSLSLRLGQTPSRPSPMANQVQLPVDTEKYAPPPRLREATGPAHAFGIWPYHASNRNLRASGLSRRQITLSMK